MIAKTDIVRIYETVLSIPGMNEKVKIGVQTSRKNLLLLNKVIEKGLTEKAVDDKTIGIIESLPEEAVRELKEIAVALLEKAGLTEMNEKLKSF